MSDEHIVLRSDRIDWREAGSEIVALDRETSEYLAINESGLELWRALARGTTTQELADTLRESYGLTPERAAEDAERFVASLHERGLLQKKIR
jgi:hypothetical protein